jgi:hypothetical protein
MNIIKCDICNKIIKKGTESVHLGIGGFFNNRTEICEKCSQPILKFLKNKTNKSVEKLEEKCT